MYFCANCGKIFKTGMYEEERKIVRDPQSDEDEVAMCLMYDDICPYCGAEAGSFWEWLRYKVLKF